MLGKLFYEINRCFIGVSLYKRTYIFKSLKLELKIKIYQATDTSLVENEGSELSIIKVLCDFLVCTN